MNILKIKEWKSNKTVQFKVVKYLDGSAYIANTVERLKDGSLFTLSDFVMHDNKQARIVFFLPDLIYVDISILPKYGIEFSVKNNEVQTKTVETSKIITKLVPINELYGFPKIIGMLPM